MSGKEPKKITMSKINKRRLQKDIVDIIKEPLTDNGIYYAHDEENMAKIGDVVTVQECKPYSKSKTWKLLSANESVSPQVEMQESQS